MDLLHIDLESRSELSVKDCGAFAYAEHPSTRIICCAYAINDGPVECLTYEDLIAPDGSQVPAPIAALLAAHPDAMLVSHNNDFERCMLSRLVDPGVLQREWMDVAVWSACLGLPRALDDLSAFLWPDKPEMQKDAEGHRVMLQLSVPRRASKTNKDQWWTPSTKPDAFQRLYAYCKRDVSVMRAALHRLAPPPARELAVWKITTKMNQRGIRLDLESIPHAQAHLAKHLQPLEAEFATLCPHPPKSYARVAAHFGMPDVKKATIRETLRRPDLAPNVRRGLELLRQLALSSPAKLEAMLQRVSQDGRLRGALVYGGAERTLRWSSWGVQLQNLKRGLGELTDAAFEALALGALAEIFSGIERQAPELPADAVALIAEMLRGFLVGPFLVGDYAQIEARTEAWIAGETSLLDIFAAHGDPYAAKASDIYGRKITKKDKAERFMGKQVVLGAGYAMGHVRFRNMLAEVYDLEIDEAFAKKVIYAYRASVPRIVRLWDVLLNGFRFVIGNKSRKVKIPDLPVNIFMGTETIGGTFFAWIELPSGRRLWYADARIVGKEIRYYGRNIYKGGAWELVPTHGGKITENITQAAARDVMAEAMLRLDAAGFLLEGTVHDELIAAQDVPDEEADTRLEEFRRLMVVAPSWATGLPLDVEVFRCTRYRK